MPMAETTHEGTHVAGAAEGGGHTTFPPFDSSTFAGQLLWFAIAFAALYVVMSRLALPRVAAILADRAGRLSADLKAANALKAETDAAITAYEKALSDAKAKAQGIAAENRDRLAADSEAKRKAVESELAQKLHAAEEVIAKGRSDAMGHVRTIAADAASAIVQQLMGKAPGRDEVERALAKVSSL
jgi:F-type H+-transporting ATPase subunit b